MVEMNDKEIEAIGAVLADRLYAYRLLHVAYGAKTDREIVEALCSEQTAEVFTRLSDLGPAKSIYLKTYDAGEEITVRVDRAIRGMGAFGHELSIHLSDPSYMDELGSIYTKLFDVPGPSYVSPWESPYLGTDNMLFKESTIDVRRRYAERGYRAVAYKHFPEDHISMMLDFMAQLSARSFDAFADSDDESFEKLLLCQVDFLSSHMGDWLKDFHRELCMKDESGVFAELAEIMRAFIIVDKQIAGSLAEACR